MKTLFLIISIVLLKRFLLKLVGISFFMKVGIIKYSDELLLLDKTFIKFLKKYEKLLKKKIESIILMLMIIIIIDINITFVY